MIIMIICIFVTCMSEKGMCMWGWAWSREFSLLMAWRKKLFFCLSFGHAGMESFARWQPLEEFVFARVVSVFNDLPSSGGSPAWCKCAAGWAVLSWCDFLPMASSPGYRRGWSSQIGTHVNYRGTSILDSLHQVPSIQRGVLWPLCVSPEVHGHLLGLGGAQVQGASPTPWQWFHFF